jgi:Tol biopolymer transport system component
METSGEQRRRNGGKARPMFFRRLVACLLALLTLMGMLALGAAVAAAPTGPRLAVIASHPYPRLSEIETVGPTGTERDRLVGGEGEGVTRPNGDRPAWSPDGSLLAFTGSFGEYSPVVYVVGADGGKPRLVSKGGPLSDPIFSPDGRSLVFSTLRVVKGEFRRPARRADDDYGVVVELAVVAVDIASGRVRLLTPWRRNQVITPTSFSPDGSKLAAERYMLKGGGEAVAIDLKSGRTTVLARDALEPVYSPDGSRIAFLRSRYGRSADPGDNRLSISSDLLVMPASGGKPSRLARAKGGIAWPSWDPSGQRLSFTRLDGGSLGSLSQPHQSNAVMEINADGSCLTRLLSIEHGSFGGSAWQPGPGREAGPIVC